MLASTKAMDSLKTIGLNLYERKLWVALLAKGTSTAGELSQMSNVPRSRTYDILESLTEKGFVITQVGKPVRFVAIKPEEALERVKRKMVADTEEMTNRIDELKKSAVVRELKELFGKGIKTVVPEEMTGTIKGKHQLHHQVSSMFKNANKKIHIATNADGLKELNQNHYNHLKKAKNKGVDIKIVSVVNDDCKDAVKSLSSVAKVKESKSKVKGNFLIVDGNESILALTDPGKTHETQHLAIWSRSEHANSDVLGPLFEMIWEKSNSL